MWYIEEEADGRHKAQKATTHTLRRRLATTHYYNDIQGERAWSPHVWFW
jgi:hypothetical protein